jgi:hypothetical protein
VFEDLREPVVLFIKKRRDHKVRKAPA